MLNIKTMNAVLLLKYTLNISLIAHVINNFLRLCIQLLGKRLISKSGNKMEKATSIYKQSCMYVF